jgi:hypothetical protein
MEVKAVDMVHAPTFWARHRTFEKILRHIKAKGLIFIGYPVALAIGAILTIAQVLLTIILSEIRGKLFALMNFLFLAGNTLKLCFQHVRAAAPDDVRLDHIRDIRETQDKIHDCALNIARGFLHFYTLGVVGNLNFLENTSDFRFNTMLTQNRGALLTLAMLQGLRRMIKAENNKLDELNNPDNAGVRDPEQGNQDNNPRGFSAFSGQGHQLGEG